MQIIRRNPDITRNEIAAMTSLASATICNIVARLMETDLVIESGQRLGGLGQPAMRLRINPKGGYGIGLSIDGDHVTMVSLDLAGTVRSRSTRRLAFASPNDVVRFVEEGIARIKRADAIGFDRVLGMGVALPEHPERDDPSHRSPGYQDWSHVDIRTMLASIVPWPTHIDENVAAAAIGEAHFGDGQDYASFFYIFVGAELGGGMVINGTYHRGANVRSGGLGCLPLGTNPTEVLRDVVSSSAFSNRLQAAGLDVALLNTMRALPAQYASHVAEWLQDASDSLVPALAAVNCLLNPAVVLIAGRLPVDILDRLAAAVHSKFVAAVPDRATAAPIARARLSYDAPAIGAATLPLLDRILPSDAILIKRRTSAQRPLLDAISVPLKNADS
ncbi:ROK family transcriptional regulator [Sphingomonas faeni]